MSSSTPFSWPSILSELIAGRDLDEATSRDVMSTILRGDASEAQIAAFLVALRAKGEHVDELTGLLDGALAEATIVPLTEDERSRCVDIVGTGGDGSHSINVSTMAALVIAGAGVPVCKHGNRSASSKCGSADLLELLGVVIELGADGVAACVREAGIGFCFAPVFHPAFRFAGPPRREIGVPTAFNLLGPMANPGRVRRQVIGVADPRFVEPMALTLQREGLSHAWVVHGDGLDELTTTGTSTVLALANGSIDEFTIDPGRLGLSPATPDDLRGGDPDENAEAIRRVLGGEAGPHRDIVVLNAAAGLVVGGVAVDLAAGLEVAGAAIDDGRAQGALDALVSVSRAHAE
ncbi:MAG TPA: anthranilate phosphoribosyltransferase [Ilumatobacteraceae bacterium]|nr:anthranilate phosphoribosyltransferase [Ilumatobacteraceae bacterium]